VVVVDIDPPLLADEIEINVDDDDAESAIESMTIAERAALSDLLAPRAHQR
jgi:hypothetical protein